MSDLYEVMIKTLSEQRDELLLERAALRATNASLEQELVQERGLRRAWHRAHIDSETLFQKEHATKREGR